MGNPNHDQKGRFSSGSGGSGGSNKRGHMGKLDTGMMTPAMQRMTGAAHVDSNGRALNVGDRVHDNLGGVDGRVTTKHFEGGNGKPLVTVKSDQGVSITRSPQDLSSGAAVGDHQAESPSTATRNVPGHGSIDRASPVARHAGNPGIGLSITKTTKGLRQAAKEGVARGQMIDATHWPTGKITQPVVTGYRRSKH